MDRLRVVARQTAVLGSVATAGLADDLRSLSSVAETARAALLDPVDESAEHVGFRVAEVLQAHGVKFVFCLSGGHISPMLVGAEHLGIKVVDVRHEVNTVFAADAVARTTGVTGVAMVTAGPGITNTVTAVKNASMAQSPIVLIGGAAPLATQGRGALQDIDQRVLLEPIVKKCWTVRAVRDVVPSLRQAFQEAASGVPGPCFVELPLDILYPYLFIAAEAGLYQRVKCKDVPAAAAVVVPVEHQPVSQAEYLAKLKPDEDVFLRKPEQLGHKAIRAALRYRFAGARLPQDVSPLPVFVPKSPEKDVSKAAALLREAKRPVFVLGSQSAAQPGKMQELSQALQKLGAPVFLGGMSRGLLGRDCDNFIRQNRGQALAKSDLIVLVGSVVDFRLSYGKVLPKSAKVVAVSRDQAHLDLNRTLYAELAGMGWRAALASLGDPCDFVLRLAGQVDAGSRFQGWAAELKALERKKEEANRASGREPALGRGEQAQQQLINPIAMLQDLEELLPDNAVLVADGGDFVATAAYILRPRAPLSWLDPGQFGTLGVGGGFALGAKLANPEAEVWLLWGDGAAGYSIAEFDTFKRHGVNVIALVGNDACWGQIERDQTTWFGSSVSCDLEYTNYEKVAEGFGGQGICVRQPEQARQALQDAQSLSAKGPVLLNALIGRTKFREGSISA